MATYKIEGTALVVTEAAGQTYQQVKDFLFVTIAPEAIDFHYGREVGDMYHATNEELRPGNNRFRRALVSALTGIPAEQGGGARRTRKHRK